MTGENTSLMDLADSEDKSADEDLSNRHPAELESPPPEEDKKVEPDDKASDRPENIPEQFWDAEAGEVKTVELAKSYSDLRKQFNQLQNDKGEVPEDQAEYLTNFEFKREDGKTDNIPDIADDDPGLAAAAAAAKNAGLSTSQFASFVNDFLQAIDPALSDAMPEQVDLDAEIAKLGGKEKAIPVIKANAMFIRTMVDSGTFSEAEAEYAKKFAETAVGVSVLNKLRVNTGEAPIPMNVIVTEGAKSEADIQKMMADDRYKAQGSEGDAYRAEVEEEIARMNNMRGG